MAEKTFEAITTKEQFDALVNPMLEKARKEAVKPFADYDAVKGQVATLTKDLAARDSSIASLKANEQGYRIAHEEGLPYELAARITGKDETEMREDAQALVKLIGQKPEAPPLRNNEPEPSKNPTQAALKTLLSNLRKE